MLAHLGRRGTQPRAAAPRAGPRLRRLAAVLAPVTTGLLASAATIPAALTGVVSRERAKATWLTGVAGLVILAAAFVMMACAAPSLAHPRPHGAMAQPASVYTSWPITGNWSARWAGRAGRGGHAAGQAERSW
jgi:hypothetical protein